MTHAPDFDAERTRLIIPHYELTIDDLPAPSSSWSELVPFAESFDSAVIYPEYAVMERVASEARQAFELDAVLPKSLTMLRTALSAERRFPHHDGPREDPERMLYAHALVESIRSRIAENEHTAPPATPGGVEDRVMNAYDRLLAGYAHWGGWRYHGWGGYEDPATYLGPAVWSERDCDLRLAYELEREFPNAVHMEFPIAKWTRHDFAAPEVVQRVDVVVSEFDDFIGDDQASLVFKERHHQASFEVKWCTRGWAANSRELNARRLSIPEDVRKLANHVRLARCEVAAVVVFDDNGWFNQQELKPGRRMARRCLASRCRPPRAPLAWPHHPHRI